MKTIAITGASGFVGSNLISHLLDQNYNIISINREVLNDEQKLDEVIFKSDVVINLSGATILKKWTPQYKELLYKSRIETTNKLVNSINKSHKKPELFISTSAIGIYDQRDTYDEKGDYANDFLSKLCQKWEIVAKKADTKVSIFRFGVVLGHGGGAFSKMLKPFRLGLGGPIASGNQAFSFIHIEDLLRAYSFVIQHKLNFTFNLTCPKPTTNLRLTRVLSRAVRKPALLPLPEFVLKFIYGEGAVILTEGQDIIPKRLLDLGFRFKYNDIEETIENLV